MDNVRADVNHTLNLIAQHVSDCSSGPLMVHSDLFRARSFVSKSAGKLQMLDGHVEVLGRIGRGRDIWLPAFTYAFLRTGTFEPDCDPAEIGPLPEHFRKNHSLWRSEVPVFSFSGTGALPEVSSAGEIDPFGESSMFSQLVHRNGVLLFYGTDISSGTIIHHAERIAGGPPYRYDKVFSGRIFRGAEEIREVRLRYHVRPLLKRLEYDFRKIQADMQQAGVTREFLVGGASVLVAPAKVFVEWLVQRIGSNPTGLLDEESRGWVDPLLQALGRPFYIEDFEEVS